MGCFFCCCCCSYQPGLIDGVDELSAKVLRELGLQNSEINKLYQAFTYVDVDSSGSITCDEFFAFFRVESTALTRQIFAVMDFNHSRRLGFGEYAVAMWNFLSIRPDFLGCFVFFLYDDRQKGALTLTQIQALVEAVHPGTFDSNSGVKKLVMKLNGKKNAHWKIETFTDWARANPAIIQPFIAIQHKLRSEVVGHRFWEDLTARRQMVVQHGHPRFCVKLFERVLDEVGSPGEAPCSVGHKKPSKVTTPVSLSNSKVSPEPVVSTEATTTQPNEHTYDNEVFRQIDAYAVSTPDHSMDDYSPHGHTNLDNLADNVQKGLPQSGLHDNKYIKEGDIDGYYYDYQKEEWAPNPDTVDTVGVPDHKTSSSAYQDRRSPPQNSRDASAPSAPSASKYVLTSDSIPAGGGSHRSSTLPPLLPTATRDTQKSSTTGTKPKKKKVKRKKAKGQ